MANYKPVVSLGSVSIPDILFEDLYESDSKGSSSSANTFTGYGTVIADTGSNGTKIYGIFLDVPSQVGNGNVMIEIATGIASSEVVVLRYMLRGNAADMNIFIPCNRTIAANSRLSWRIKDFEAAVNTFGIAINVGVK